MNKFLASLLATGVIVSAGAASAAIFQVVGTPTTVTLPTGLADPLNFDLDDYTPAGSPPLGMNTVIDAATYDSLSPTGSGDDISAFSGAAGPSQKVAGNGLQVSAPAFITYTFLGSEAGNSNSAIEFTLGSTTIFTNSGSAVGDTAGAFEDEGFIDFLYRTNQFGQISTISNSGGATGPNASLVSLGFSPVFVDSLTPAFGSSVIAFFTDNGFDGDFDDFAMRLDAAPVPLPAAAWMLISALVGLGALRARRAAA